MSRYISFVTLLIVIVLVVLLFYRVIAGFMIPLFLAALLVVIFRPLHLRILERCQGRKKTAAMLTTVAILLAVLVPLGILFTLAVFEGQQLLRSFNKATLMKIVVETRTKLNLELPRIAEELQSIRIRLDNLSQIERLEDVAYLRPQLDNTSRYNNDLATKIGDQLERSQAAFDAWDEYLTAFSELQRIQSEIADPAVVDPADEDSDSEWTLPQVFDFQQQQHAVANKFADFKVQVLGGSALSVWLRELANPTPEVLEQYGSNALGWMRSVLVDLGALTSSFVGRLLLGSAIMIIALYFFLLDGPALLESLKSLSPIDDEYEQELIVEFGKVSRAVVVATLLAAIVQALLGGIGYYFAGLESVFLLTLLTGCLALVPFVGAAAVWFPCCLWLYFINDQPVAAIGLAIYGTAIISMADNVIKPLVLHGQSKLHPLLALLSVLGGVSALGPIGILIGPMIVAFLQTLLKILQREMSSLDKPREPVTT